MRPTVLTETPPFAGRGFVSFEGRLTRGHGEPLGRGEGAGAKDSAMNLPTGVAVAMFEPVDLTLDLILDCTTMATSCEHSVSPVLKVRRFWSQLSPDHLPRPDRARSRFFRTATGPRSG